MSECEDLENWDDAESCISEVKDKVLDLKKAGILPTHIIVFYEVD